MKKTFLAFATALTICACAALPEEVEEIIQPEEIESEAGTPFSFTAALATKTVADGFSVSWSAEDQVSVFNAPEGGTYSANEAFSLTNVENGIFEGILSSALESDKYDWTVVYPYNSENVSLDALALTVGLADLTVAAGSTAALAGDKAPCAGTVKGLAKDDALSLNLKQLASGVKLTLKNPNEGALEISKVKLTFPVAVVGEFTVDVTGEANQFTPVEGEATNAVTVTLSEAVSLAKDETIDLYIPIAPVSIEAGDAISCLVNDEIEIEVSNGGITFKPGVLKHFNVSAVVKPEITVTSIAMPNSDWSKNGYPVFNKECTRAYFYGIKNDNTLRTLYEVNLETKSLGWSLNLTNSEKAWSNNGGDMAVNPKNGDIICCNQCEIFCVKSDGSKRWTIGAGEGGTGLASTNTGSAMQGCGPAFNNDCSVFFACVNSKLLAIKSDDGTILDKFESLSGNCQFIVYGENKIVAIKKATTGGIIFLSFADNKFTKDATLDSPFNDTADITSGAMTSDQSKAFFMAKGYTICVDVVNKVVTYENRTSIMGSGYRWAPCLTSDGYLVMGIQFNGTDSRIGMFNTAASISSEDNGETIFAYSGYNSALNFEGVSVDTKDNIYCFINDPKGKIVEGENKSYLIRLSKDTEGYTQKYLATFDSVAQGTYQGCFNYGGNYIITVSGNPGTIYIFDLAATRGHGWSGAGGDPQATKNANIVYAK